MFDVIVVGGGPAGLSAALMLGRCRRRVLICDLGQPRNRRSRSLHGDLIRDGIAPPELNELGRRELAAYDIDFRCTGVTAAHRELDHFRVALGTGAEELSRHLLITTGVVDDLPAINGFEECYGQSIFHCPYCDGWECRDRRLAAFGRGRQVTGLALALKTWSRDVLVCTHGARVDGADRERLALNGIAVRTERIEELLHEDGQLSRIVFATGAAVDRDALFFSTGQHPQSPLAIGLGCTLTNRGAVKTGNGCDTNVERVFVAGDASRDAQFVVVAAAEGVKAACAINRALQAAELVR
ncbi:MAG TPA: NAD(P)/FAD-dependent oxidoreductase [Vicinamibacterales bacterium]|nr:NAD(P)/FAD-dependent oxidoreductase [Vicinamibacterales bacterium]